MTALPLSTATDTGDLAQSLYGLRFAPSREGAAPSPEELLAILEAAAAVPDHGYLRPWRFVVVTEGARGRLADALGADALAASGDPALATRARQKAEAAPCLLMLVASLRPEAPIPLWEQLASAACTGYAAVLAAHGLGLGAVWKSTHLRDGEQLRQLCGCSEHEELLGWVLLGTRDEEAPPKRRSRPPFDAGELATVLS
jgi:nitroreductase